MKVAIDSGPLNSGHSIRGVGFSTQLLIESIKQHNKSKYIQVFPVDFSNEDLSRYDLIHKTAFNPYFFDLPEKYLSKTILTIHDLIPLVYPNVYASGIRGKVNYLRNKIALKKVKHVVTVSETSKKDIIRFFNIDDKRISVIYWAARNEYKPISNKKFLSKVKKKYNLPEKFVLYVGDVNYNKNIKVLVDACNIAKIHLVIVGKQALEIDNFDKDILVSINGPRDYLRFLIGETHPEITHLHELCKTFKSKNVTRLGFVSNEDLVGIYNLANCYVQPSLYEGFGLPVLEALACGTPTIISKTQALVEITDGLVPTFGVDNPDELAELIRRNRNAMSIKKDSQTLTNYFGKKYSWSETARKHIDLYMKFEKNKK